MIKNSAYKRPQQLKGIQFLLLWSFILIQPEVFCQTDNEFWFAAPEISFQFSSSAGITSTDRDRPIQLILTCFDQAANVVICQPANLNFPIIHQYLPADTFIIVDLTPFIDIIENKPADAVLPYGLLITSDNPITVNYEVTHYSVPYGNGAMYILKGRNALGFDFVIPAQTLYPNFQYCDPPARNCFDIVAVEDSTQITILPSANIIGHDSGVPFIIYLNRGESWEGRALSETISGHLIGTTIHSDKPIAVTVSDDNIFVNNQPQSTDLSGDQLIPANIAGIEYGDIEESVSHSISICAFYDGTVIFHNGVFALSINKGQCLNYQVNTGPHYFNSNKPIMLYSHLIHPAFNQAGGTVLAPLTCNGSKKVILPTPFIGSGSQGEAHEIVIITKPNNTITTVINGSSFIIPSNSYFPFPGTGGAWVYASITSGTVGYPQYFLGTKRFILDVGNIGPGISSYYKLGCISNFSIINLGPDRQICMGDSVKLDAGYGHDSIHWSNGDTTQTIVIKSAGTYSVTVFDNDGCILSDTIHITNFSISNPLDLGPDTVLCSDSISLNAGTGRFSYLWNTGDTTNSIWISSPGLYSVTVISNPEMCLLRDTIEVQSSGIQSIDIGQDTSICANDSIQLDAGLGMNSYLWNTGATTQTIWAKNIGKYKVTVTKGACIFSDSLMVSFIPVPTVNLGPDISICLGQTHTFDAGFCLGCTYSWDNLSTNQMNIGTNQTYTTEQAGIYRVTVTASNGCYNQDTVQLFVNAGVPVTIVITSSLNNVCQGTFVTFSAHTTNGGALPSFQWKVNEVNVGMNDSTFTYIPLNTDIVSCILTSVDTICLINNPAISNSISMIVYLNLPVSVTIVASQNPVCIDTGVTFTATPVNGGTTPLYQWYNGSSPVGVNSPNYFYIPANGDIITVVMTSNASPCLIGSPATSNAVTMIINNSLLAGVSIVANPNPFCMGTTVNYSSTPLNGGPFPVYQWKVNGNNTGTNSPNFSYSPQSGDSIWCTMTSNLTCVSGNPATSNKIIMVSAPVPVVNFTYCFDSITTINARPIKLKGGIPLGGTYSGLGVNSITGVFTPSAAGTGIKTITYSYTNVSLCSASKTKTVIVQSASAFVCGNNMTDIRDGNVYPTLQLGSQCWMATNLNYGTMILASSHQRDNCISEKYCYNDLTANCQLGITTYQWDELMQYDDTPGMKGLCPPGWHVPTETEFNTLFANWTNNAFAGSPLKYSGYSGFNALLSGVRHLNSQWDYQNFATFFWSSTPNGVYKAWAHGLNEYDPSVAVYPSSRANGYSVRCIKD